MAQKRMFTMKIVDSDAFLDMPVSAQLLYFHLGMRADDDGFVDRPKRVMKDIGVNEDDLKILIAKKFILTSHEQFEPLHGSFADKRRKVYNGMLKCYIYQYFK